MNQALGGPSRDAVRRFDHTFLAKRCSPGTCYWKMSPKQNSSSKCPG